MRERTLLLWILGALAAACAVHVAEVAKEERDSASKEPEPPRLTLNHEFHLDLGPECADCHAPDENGEPGRPNAEFCFECHDDMEKAEDQVRAYFDAIRQPDGSYEFPKLSYSDDLIFRHAPHTEYGATCDECHGPPPSKAYTRPPLRELKRDCMDCHEEKGAPNDCAVCHKETRKDKAPPSHFAAFRKTHGKEAPEGWREGRGDLCALCHEVPQSCNACHERTPPESHRTAAFHFTHGAGDFYAPGDPWEDVSCSLCHEEQSCVRCHQVQKPRNHTRPFERRLHGIAAEIDRQRCTLCHKQRFCVNCHEVAVPISHRGSWSTGQQTHCIACHEPLQASGCFTCHKNTLGHLGSTPLPADAVHFTASDPSDCRDCHPVLPHLDGARRCRSCHR